MKRLSTLVLLATMTATGSALGAGSMSHRLETDQTVIPVLVQVNAHGKVTRVSPSAQLAPRYQRLLRDNIEQLVVGPARSNNQAVSSQFVMNVTLKSMPRDDGKYDAHFAYVSARPVPLVPMHWVNIDGRRLELARRTTICSVRGNAKTTGAPIVKPTPPTFGASHRRRCPPTPAFLQHRRMGKERREAASRPAGELPWFTNLAASKGGRVFMREVR